MCVELLASVKRYCNELRKPNTGGYWTYNVPAPTLGGGCAVGLLNCGQTMVSVVAPWSRFRAGKTQGCLAAAASTGHIESEAVDGDL